MKKSLLLLAICSIIFMGFQLNNSHKKRTKFNKNENMIEKLKLTEAQEKQFHSKKFEKEEKEIELQSQMKINRLNMKKLIANDNFEQDDLFKLIDTGSKLKSEMAKIKTEFWFEIRDILNEDQKKIWQKHLHKIVTMREGIRHRVGERVTKQRMRRGVEREGVSKREFRRMND